ncbi:hypothetical protein HPB47_006523 [Ixodes persulcatus]|uniref:Uncharacterized protein n=1 Tax=Ixodes persulcatus TaxID=34615 RepID=A0AC60P9X5_IXOPE|nr:hypothetical protein HPB47_006523 [Ixodes persulcatus]
MQLMTSGDPTLFHKYYQVSLETYNTLHGLVEHRLTKQCLCRQPLSSGERLALTLRYLSSEMQIQDVAMTFRVGIETAREAIHLICEVLWEELSPHFIKSLLLRPPTQEKWREIAAGVWHLWQFPNCLGAVLRKQVIIKCPKKAGIFYFNYKTTHSIMLMAVVDDQYLFRLIDMSAPGRLSDGGIFKDSAIGQ